MVSRADRGVIAEWWWTVDKTLLAALIFLLVGGVILSLGGSPAVAERLGYDSFHFVSRHVIFFIPTVVVLVATSFLTPRLARRISLILLVGMVSLCVMTLLIGVQVNGSRRWMDVAGFSLQPSEFLKPAFIVVCAWLFTENARNADVPGNLFATLLLGIVCVLLIAQPDFGQTMLIGISWAIVFFLAGMPWTWILVVAVAAVVGVIGAYTTIPHVAGRIDSFLGSGGSDSFQIETALASIVNGGWLGVGPGEGTVKRILPDSHTDFIFAVAAEEFGIVVCVGLVAVFGFVVIRGLSRALRNEDAFGRVAAAGLVSLFGIQSVINMAVNLHLMPSKGMTLPFISYGGSSMLAIAFGMGLVLALTRRQPQTGHIRRRAVPRSGVPNPA
ncbi:MAG: cell division protein FtsW [Bauldia sp.]|nr:cell division protein FtsW [Bauldia sp.]